MQKFQEILAEAAQLKQTQLKNERKNYESLPEYLKSGLNYSKKYQALRKQDYMIQMNMSEKLKKDGNLLFKEQNFNEALSKYEEALAIFRHINAKSYDNMKDEDLEYLSFSLPEGCEKFKEEYQAHLMALYLNICSCLTKTNKKEDAVHSAEEALKIKQTAKAYYKKAQAYLQFINREGSDIKVGFFFLNKCYQISKDPSIVQEMHKIKKQNDEERTKQKQWFKFMFDKNSQNDPANQEKSIKKEEKVKVLKQVEVKPESKFNQQLMEELQKGHICEKQDDRLQKTKEKLSKFISTDLSQEQWQEVYEGEFISKHGSKIYSIVQLLGYKEHLGEYRALLAQCLEFKKEEGGSIKKREVYSKYFQWLRDHPIDKISKYLQRYELQTKWIGEQRENNKHSLQTEKKNIELKEESVLKQSTKIQEIPIQLTEEKQKVEPKQVKKQKEETSKSERNDLKKQQKSKLPNSVYKSTAFISLFLLALWILWIFY